MKLLSRLVPVLLAGCIALNVSAQVRIRKSASDSDRNPTLVFKGISGNPQLSKEVYSFLNACGWFDITSGGNSDYTIAGSAAGAYLDMEVMQGGRPMYRFRISQAAEARKVAQKTVDAILKKLFDIKGICASRIVFCAETGRGIKNIYFCDIDGGGLVKVTDYTSMCVEPGWFPDGKSIAYTRYGSSTTDIIETKISPRMSRCIASYPGINVGASISPNGKYLALILSRDNKVELYIKSVNGTAKRRLTEGKAVEASPCWSPDGGKLCFVSDQNGGAPQLFTIGANGAGLRKLSTISNESVTPDWSSDNKIVYSARMGGGYAIAVLDLSGQTSGGVVTNASGNWESPSWAPDNRHVVCSRSSGRSSSLFIVDTRTGKMRQLLRTGNNLSMPSWSNLN
ncbi:MAG: hypothetical protein WC071_06635 [Victivallaceae bacterium]